MQDALCTSISQAAKTKEQYGGRTFHLFRQLPAELQAKIWDMAFAAPVLCEHVKCAFRACDPALIMDVHHQGQSFYKMVQSMTHYAFSPAGVVLTNGVNRGMLAACSGSRHRAMELLRLDYRTVPCAPCDVQDRDGEYVQDRDSARSLDHVVSALIGINTQCISLSAACRSDSEDTWHRLVQAEHAFRRLGYHSGVRIRRVVGSFCNPFGYTHTKIKVPLSPAENLVNLLRYFMRMIFIKDESLVPNTADGGPIPRAACIGFQFGYRVKALLGVELFHSSGLADKVTADLARQNRVQKLVRESRRLSRSMIRKRAYADKKLLLRRRRIVLEMQDVIDEDVAIWGADDDDDDDDN